MTNDRIYYTTQGGRDFIVTRDRAFECVDAATVEGFLMYEDFKHWFCDQWFEGDDLKPEQFGRIVAVRQSGGEVDVVDSIYWNRVIDWAGIPND